ncbi:MAG TPA: type II toxin-antitoxin system PemK/MazF family toxin [Candidatus Nitrosotenuis sp.]
MVSKFDIFSRDIVIAVPDYTDQSEPKPRPLIVISKSLFHQNSGFFVCVGITTNQKPDPYLIPIKPQYVENVELQEKSQVMCKRIVTVRSDKITKRIAKITPEFYAIITKKIKDEILEL